MRRRRRFARHFFPRRRKWRRCVHGWATLADVPPGCRARLGGFESSLSPEQLTHLQAYGLVPGHWVRVLQHFPVTVVQIEHTELALEGDLARQIRVTGE